jgi:hypothetical protein
MGNPTDAIVAALEREWPDWQVWVVYRAVGGPVWCARRWDGTGETLNADSSDDLTCQIEQKDRPL